LGSKITDGTPKMEPQKIVSKMNPKPTIIPWAPSHL
jgi:hypothetical protein